MHLEVKVASMTIQAKRAGAGRMGVAFVGCVAKLPCWTNESPPTCRFSQHGVATFWAVILNCWSRQYV